MPNAAEAVLADAIQTAGTAGFEAALSGFLRESIACNNVVVIAFRRAAAPEILCEQADDPVVFRNLHRVYVGRCLSSRPSNIAGKQISTS